MTARVHITGFHGILAPDLWDSTRPQVPSGFYASPSLPPEALPGALPARANLSRRIRWACVPKQLTATAFTAPRGATRWAWTYRIRPGVLRRPFREIESGLLRGGPFLDAKPSPNQLRWGPLKIPAENTDFIQGIVTMGGNGDPAAQAGVAIHIYAANASMQDRFFYNADGEMLIVPQLGGLRFHTELGILDVAPGEICVMPRRVRFPRGTGGSRGPRVYLREPRRTFPLAGIGADPACAGAGQRARFRGAGGRVRGSGRRFPADRRSLAADCGRRRSITRRWMWSRGTGTWHPTNMT